MNTEFCRAYFLDRINELLIGDVRNGSPFVFISSLNLLTALSNQADIYTPDFFSSYLPENYREFSDALYSLKWSLNTYYSLNIPYVKVRDMPIRISLTHQNDKHFHISSKELDEKQTLFLILSAEPFLKDIKTAIITYFDMAMTVPTEAEKLEANLKKRPVIGYGYSI
jgi:hypothetical protein